MIRDILRRGTGGSADDAGSAPGAGAPAVRTMRASDLDRVLAIEQACFAMPWSRHTYANLLRRRDADLFVAEADGLVVGHTAIWGVLDESELGTLAVAPRYRRRGIAAALLGHALDRAAERGWRATFLEVRVSNASARALYGRFGFREVGVRRNYYAFPLEDALVLRRDLLRDPPAGGHGARTRGSPAVG